MPGLIEGKTPTNRSTTQTSACRCHDRACHDLSMDPAGVTTSSEIGQLRRELERLRAENARLSRLLDLRGQNLAPAPEQLSAAVAAPGFVAMASPVEDKLDLYANR